MFQKLEVKLVSHGEDSHIRGGLEGQEEFENDRVGTGFTQFVNLDHGFQARDQSGIEKVLFGESARACQAVAAFNVVNDLRLGKVGDVVALVVKVVRLELFVVEGVEPGEEALGIRTGTFRGLDRIVACHRGDATEFTKGFVIPGPFGETEEKETEAPTGYREGPGQKVGERPPEPGGAPLDEFLEIVGPGHEESGIGRRFARRGDGEVVCRTENELPEGRCGAVPSHGIDPRGLTVAIPCRVRGTRLGGRTIHCEEEGPRNSSCR